MADQAARHFMPWVRQGLASGITTADTRSDTQAAHVSLRVTLTLAQITPGTDVRLHGPGDITAIDASGIVRTDPQPGATDFAPNYFPLIEFDRPDFPWMFTPAAADANERLRPWLCLVVVKAQQGVTIARHGQAPLPALDIADPAHPDAELPDLAESWAWAHAQVLGAAGQDATSLRDTITGAPALTVARLLCPRRLDPRTTYHACVVPAFDVGRRAGLGLPPEGDDLAPAWRPGADSVSLPVYFTWTFTTSEKDDFESLVRLLEPRPIPDTVGTRPLDLREPGFGLPSTPGAIIAMGGVLRATKGDATENAVVPAALIAALARLVNAPDDALQDPTNDPVVAPPIYGSAYPPVSRVEVAAGSPPWVHTLNLDPRHRIAAGLGTRIVQRDQEALMASAWQQAAVLRAENENRRRRRLAIAGRTSTFERHVQRLDADALLQVLGPGMAKVASGEPGHVRTVAAQVRSSEFPQLVEPALRRVARPRGPINRRALPASLRITGPRRLVKLVDRLPELPPLRPLEFIPMRLPGMVTVQRVSAAAGAPLVDGNRLTAEDVQATPDRGFLVWVGDHWERSRVALARDFRQAAIEHLQHALRPAATAQLQFSLPDMSSLLRRLDPRGVARTPRDARPVADDEPIVAHPTFPQPMSERLVATAPRFLLPGLEDVPANTVTLVNANAPFIEAFMVGLNHEMGRELLWREYPTDQRGTYFDRFWDTRGAVDENAVPPLPPVPLWTQPLGENAKAATGADMLILLVRGELLRRYPTAMVYAARARRDPDGGIRPTDEERYPLFRGSAPPDVTFLGFDLAEAAARGDELPDGDPGWFFVIKQQPGEPSFGLDMDPGGDPPKVTRWNDLTWRHVVETRDDLEQLSHLRVAQGTPPRPDTSANPPGAQWGQDAAHMARITLQLPVRIAILARLMLPPEGPPDA